MVAYESKKRSIAKALSWRVFATFITGMVVYLWTGEVAEAVGIGLIDTSAKLLIYFLHERLWLRIHWGTRRVQDYQI